MPAPAAHDRMRVATAYDEFPYPGFPFAQTHPDRLATLARLFGMAPPDVERCRVLELGCGDGGNLIPMAYGLPRSTFVGLDLASSAIERGQDVIRSLRLENIELRCGDISDSADLPGEFDFIIAHGVYSWVAADVRDRLLAACRAKLAPQGVVFVSYNALPGGHVRTLLREMMLFDAGGLASAGERVARARALLRVLNEATVGSQGYRQLIAEQAGRALGQSDAAILHDYLAPINHQLYFHEFIDHAAAHGLQYLAEADFFDMHAGVSSPVVLAALDRCGPDVLRREQYLDFLKCRMYRQTLLCRAEVGLNRRLTTDVPARFLLASSARASHSPALTDRSIAEFRGPHGAALQTDEPIVKLALHRLSESWPRRVPFDELLRDVRDAARARGAHPRSASEDQRILLDTLLSAYTANLVQFHVFQPPLAARPGERPRASALARLQATAGETVTTLTHETVRLDDAGGRRLLTLLDGTRDRDALVDRIDADGMNRSDLLAKLDIKLDDLARLALLESTAPADTPVES